MYRNKKEKLYINELLDTPFLTYPSYYVVSRHMAKNEFLHSALIALHSMDFSHYEVPQNFEKIFESFSSGAFAIYKEQYIIGYFGEKMMVLEANGWRSMPVNRDIFTLEYWLI
jgi:hypothetical protein